MNSLSLDEVCELDPGFARLIAYWRSLTPADAMAPCCDDFDLMAVYGIAPFLALVEVVPGENEDFRFKWRFSGTGIRRILGAEITGKWVDEFVHDKTSYEKVRHSYLRVVHQVQPDFWECRIRIGSSIHALHDSIDPAFDYRRLSLPLLDSAGEQVIRMVCYYSFSNDLGEHARGEPVAWIFANGKD